ncbi:MAG: transporter related protein [Pseudonocardiales bacterium]|nr:transporter related protein [Pseudonocardiales bacterium]
MTASTTVIRVDNVSKRFIIRKEKSLKERVVNFGRSQEHKEDFWALRDVDLTIGSGSTTGLIGPNGSGKSTLLKLVGGIIQPTTGQVSYRGRLAALLELGAGFHPDLTGRDNVFLNASILGLSRTQTERYFDAIVDFSGIEPFIDTQVKFYSSGMYVRLAFAVAVHVDPDILLVDEVLAVGDEPFQRKCMDRIRGFQQDGRTIVLVSHALDTVAEICDRAVVLEHGHVIADGPPRDSLKVLRAEFEITREEDREREQENAQTRRPAAARVVATRLQGKDGRLITEVTPGQDAVVSVTVDAPQGLSDWMLGVGIDTTFGQLVFGTNTKMLGIPMPSFTGVRTFEVDLPALWLGEGQYTLHGAVAAMSGVEIHRLADAQTFLADTGGRSVGYLHAAAAIDNPEGTRAVLGSGTPVGAPTFDATTSTS